MNKELTIEDIRKLIKTSITKHVKIITFEDHLFVLDSPEGPIEYIKVGNEIPPPTPDPSDEPEL